MNGTDAGGVELRDGEIIKLSLDDVTVDGIGGSADDNGPGRLVVTTTRVIFTRAGNTVDFPFEKILVHAISNDLESFPRPCIYCQIAVSGEGGEDDVTEVRFVPDAEWLQQMFDVMCESSTLVQDQNAPDDDEVRPLDREPQQLYPFSFGTRPKTKQNRKSEKAVDLTGKGKRSTPKRIVTCIQEMRVQQRRDGTICFRDRWEGTAMASMNKLKMQKVVTRRTTWQRKSIKLKRGRKTMRVFVSSLL